MNKMLAIFGLRYLAKKYDGKKAYIGAAGIALTGATTIITGIIGIIGTLYPDTNLPPMELDQAVDMVITGAGVVSAALLGTGLRHGIDKAGQSAVDGH